MEKSGNFSLTASIVKRGTNMEELTFEQLQSRQSGKLAPRAIASPDDEELTFDQLQAKAAASTSDPSYANTAQVRG